MNAYVASLKVYMLKSSAQCDGDRKWASGQCLGGVGGACMNEMSAPRKETSLSSLAPSALLCYSRKVACRKCVLTKH